MRRRRTSLLSPEGLVSFALIPGMVAVGLITVSRLLLVAGQCAIGSGYCP